MYDLANFSLSDMTRCGVELRKLGTGAGSMEEAANRIVRRLFEQLQSGNGEPACALVRMFVTVPFAELEPGQRDFVRSALGRTDMAPATKCLTLLATAGLMDAWNSRTTSTGHQALPLISEESRSEERRVGEECRASWWLYDEIIMI